MEIHSYVYHEVVLGVGCVGRKCLYTYIFYYWIRMCIDAYYALLLAVG